MKKPRLVRLSYWVWVIGPLAFYAFYAIAGAPHVIWSYRWVEAGQGMDPFAERHYTRCTYVGVHGVFTLEADGSCSWIIFRHAPAVEI